MIHFTPLLTCPASAFELVNEIQTSTTVQTRGRSATLVYIGSAILSGVAVTAGTHEISLVINACGVILTGKNRSSAVINCIITITSNKTCKL